MSNISKHIFMFPFQWKTVTEKDLLFSDQIELDRIDFDGQGKWLRITTDDALSMDDAELLYNERNYFYRFVHDALYDNGKKGRENLVRHYERIEPLTSKDSVQYRIKVKDREYVLYVSSIVLNLYSTGVGVLQFHLDNRDYDQFQDVLNISQYGRRLYPPFYSDKTSHNETAHAIQLTGLNGVYEEDFTGCTPSDHNKPAQFILDMIAEVAPNITVDTVIDDRMYVMSWLYDEQKAVIECKAYKNDTDWYRYVFVDAGPCTCQNDEMLTELIKQATYRRWLKWNSIYGVSRYSFVMLSNAGPESGEKFLYDNFETEYCRMAELVLVQKASILRFSQEVTNISVLDKRKRLPEKVDSLYKEYIRFVNQIHFREVSAQDQAIELYKMLYEQMDIEHQVEKLEGEINELHTYIELYEDRQKSKLMDIMSWFAAIALPASLLTGFFGMNNSFNNAGAGPDGGPVPWISQFTTQWLLIIVTMAMMGILLYVINNKRRK